MAINEMTADAMLGTPDSDLWHNVDDLLHNVNDLMSRLDPEPSKAESAQSGHDEGDGGFFTHDTQGTTAPEESPGTSGVQQEYFETQVSHNLCLAHFVWEAPSLNSVACDCRRLSVAVHTGVFTTAQRVDVESYHAADLGSIVL